MTSPAPSTPGEPSHPPEGAGGGAGGISVRRLRPTDSLSELTALLHRSYAKQVALGLHALASHQTPEITRKRVGKGECFVAVLSEPAADASGGADVPSATACLPRERLVGTIMFQEPSWGGGGGAPESGPRWFRRHDVCNFSQFAVEPTLQGRGIGALLLTTVEARARELGMAELALSTAEPDTELVAYYRRRGFRDVERFDWGITNYTSLIMSKAVR
ncbi:MAG: GNAT family N-acetyltransferase [Phycisphaerales bacterium]